MYRYMQQDLMEMRMDSDEELRKSKWWWMAGCAKDVSNQQQQHCYRFYIDTYLEFLLRLYLTNLFA